MGAVNIVVMVESVRAFVDHKGDDLNKFHVPAVSTSR